METTELKELAAYVATLKITTSEDLDLAIGALKEGMDAVELTKEAQAAATAELRKALDAALMPFRGPSVAAGELVAAAKASIVRHIEAEEAAALAAVKARQPVPAPLPRPKGLTVKQSLQLVSADVDKLEDRYLTAVADADAILSAVEAGEVIPGVETKLDTTVSYRRPK